MQVSEMAFDGARPVDGYGPGFFRIAGAVHEGPVLLAGGAPAHWGGMADFDALTALAGRADVLIIGTGAEIAPLPAADRARIEETGLGVEVMATAPALRSYNVLLAEDRRVALAALPL